MLTIADNQEDHFRAFKREAFEAEMVEHLHAFAPNHSGVIGDAGVLQVVQLGLKRAEEYGFTNHGPVRFYLEMMFMFGSDFDTDLLFSWATPFLTKGQPQSQMTRAMNLHEALMDYIERVLGHDRKPVLRAMRRMLEMSKETVPLPSDDDFEDAIVDLLEVVYPERIAYLGEAPLRELVQHGPTMAKHNHLHTERGVTLSIVLAYALGKGFANDPLFPWVTVVLNNQQLSEPEQRVENLEWRVSKYLERALVNLERRPGHV